MNSEAKNPLLSGRGAPRLALALGLLALLAACAGPGSVPQKRVPPAPGAAFDSDLRAPLDASLWEPDLSPREKSLCAPETALGAPTAQGLTLSAGNRDGAHNGCVSGGLRSKVLRGYGTYSATLKASLKSGEAASLFLQNAVGPKGGHLEEADFRFLGKDLQGVQVRLLDYEKGSESESGWTKWVPLKFDAGADFHVWGMRWEAGKVTWTVDGQTLWTNSILVPDEALSVGVAHWVPDPDNAVDYLQFGPLDRGSWPSAVTVREIRYDPL